MINGISVCDCDKGRQRERVTAERERERGSKHRILLHAKMHVGSGFRFVQGYPSLIEIKLCMKSIHLHPCQSIIYDAIYTMVVTPCYKYVRAVEPSRQPE